MSGERVERFVIVVVGVEREVSEFFHRADLLCPLTVAVGAAGAESGATLVLV
jgi:hypothetical protein